MFNRAIGRMAAMTLAAVMMMSTVGCGKEKKDENVVHAQEVTQEAEQESAETNTVSAEKETNASKDRNKVGKRSESIRNEEQTDNSRSQVVNHYYTENHYKTENVSQEQQIVQVNETTNNTVTKVDAEVNNYVVPQEPESTEVPAETKEQGTERMAEEEETFTDPNEGTVDISTEEMLSVLRDGYWIGGMHQSEIFRFGEDGVIYNVGVALRENGEWTYRFDEERAVGTYEADQGIMKVFYEGSDPVTLKYVGTEDGYAAAETEEARDSWSGTVEEMKVFGDKFFYETAYRNTDTASDIHSFGHIGQVGLENTEDDTIEYGDYEDGSYEEIDYEDVEYEDGDYEYVDYEEVEYADGDYEDYNEDVYYAEDGEDVYYAEDGEDAYYAEDGEDVYYEEYGQDDTYDAEEYIEEEAVDEEAADGEMVDGEAADSADGELL